MADHPEGLRIPVDLQDRLAQLGLRDHPLREYINGTAFNESGRRGTWPRPPASTRAGHVHNHSSITILGSTMEPSQQPDVSWTDSAAWIAIRAAEELARYASATTSSKFTLPIECSTRSDLLDNLELQDLFGVEPDQIRRKLGGRCI